MVDILEDQKTSNHLTTVLNTSVSAIIAIDYNLKILTFNKAAEKMFGYTHEQMQATNNLHDIIPKEFIALHDKALGNFIKSEKSSGLMKKSVEVKAKRKDGSIFPIKILIDYTGTKEDLVIVANIVDITKEKEQEAFALKQSRFASMGEMISMIAHQWRQPLTGMSMSINNLLLDIELGDLDEVRFKDNLELINKQIEYLSLTIDNFKNFFKPGSKCEMTDINALIDESCNIIGTSLKNSSITLEKDYQIPTIIPTKKNDLMQIILNLVKNSMDAYVENAISPRIIYINTKVLDDKVVIEIKDNAGGIKKDIIDKIFEPYFSTKDKKNGTGLGLYMSKMIIEDHLRGDLKVISNDGSTTFSIILPTKKDD